MASDLIAENNEPDAGSPESMLQFLAEHTESSRRRRERRHRGSPGARKAPLLLGIVAALAAVGTGVLLWANSSHRAAGAPPSRAPAKAVAGAARAGKAPKAPEARAHRAASEAWHRGLHPYGKPTKQGLPNLYYEWMQSHYSCATYVSSGCWKAKVVARRGCPHGITALVQETRDGEVVGVTTGRGRPLRPRTQGVVEVDANQQHVDGQLEWMVCS